MARPERRGEAVATGATPELDPRLLHQRHGTAPIVTRSAWIAPALPIVQGYVGAAR